MAEYKKTIYLGMVDGYGNGKKSCRAEVEVRLKGEGSGNIALSINGNRYNKRGCLESCGGQNYEALLKYFPDSPLVQRIVEIWQRWHLNDLKAGCEHQRAAGWDKKPIDPDKPTNAYGLFFEGQKQPSWNLWGWIRPDEHPDGLLTKPCPVCGYKYGTEWKTEPLPPEVIAEVKSWPEVRPKNG